MVTGTVKQSRDTYVSVGIAALYFALASRTLKCSNSWREYLANLWVDIICVWVSCIRTVKRKGFTVDIIDTATVE